MIRTGLTSTTTLISGSVEVNINNDSVILILSVNQLRVRDVIEEDEASFEVHKLEPEDMKMLVMGEVSKREL